MSVIFDQLRISEDGLSMYIDAHVSNVSYYDNLHIKKVTVCIETQVSETHPETYGENYVYQQEFVEDNLREIHLVLPANQFNEKFPSTNLSNNLFFVYVDCIGSFAPDTPCGLDHLTTLGVTFDLKVLYDAAMGYTRQLADTCNIPDGFINFILSKEALFAALETEHYNEAIKYWKYLKGIDVNGGNIAVSPKPCGCHG